jgi:hypothetical protein
LQGVLASAGVQVAGDVADPEVLSLCPSCRRHRQAEGFLSQKVPIDSGKKQMLGEEG